VSENIVPQGRLLEPFEVSREPPANLKVEDEPLFRHELHRAFGPTDLYALRRVRLTADGVFLQGFRPVHELLYLPADMERLGSRHILRKLMQRRRLFVESDERYFTAFNRWSGNNYFHWMCDVLPRVYLARDQVEGSTFVLPSSHQIAFVERSLAPFRPARIVYFDQAESAFFSEVVVPGHIAVTGNYHEPTIRGLSEFLHESFRDEPQAVERSDRLLYVTRKGAKYRYVLNEDEVISLLGTYGFEVVENERLSLEDQVRLYANVRALVGIMGANLTNVMFMRPGSSVLQLTRTADATNHLYFSLASARGVSFYYQHCDYVDAGYGIRWNLTVDLAQLEENLELMLTSTA
jgi:hypothetical protein